MAHCNYQIGIFKYENNLIFFCNASYKYDSTNGKKKYQKCRTISHILSKL